MDADRFLILVDHPEFARDSDVEDLKNFTAQYPYFSLAHMLLAKISHQNGKNAIHSPADSELIAIPDKNIFSDFLIPKETKLSEQEWMLSSASHSDIGTIEASHSVSEQPATEETFSSETNEGKASVVLEGELEDKIITEESEEYALWNQSGGTGSENAPVADPIDEEGDEQLTVEEDPEIISSNVLEEEFILLEKDKWLKEDTAKGQEISEMIPQKITAESVPEEPLIAESPDEQPVASSFLPDKKTSFVGWLKFFKKNKKETPASKPARKKETENNAVSVSAKKEGNEEFDASNLKNELTHIDKIVSEMRTGDFYKPSAENISAPDLARKSIELDEDVLSETLAQIYEEQGVYDKAIRMYARLSLKFPEKMAIFAARIKVLKKKKNAAS